MDNLNDLLQNKNFNEPEEIGLIKQFINERYHADAEVKVLQTQITVAVPGAALASSLRSDIVTIQKLCQTEKDIRIFIR